MVAKNRSTFVQLLFITFTAVTLRYDYTNTFSQMNEIKLNEFMIFVRFTFSMIFRTSTQSVWKRNGNRNILPSPLHYLCPGYATVWEVSLLCCLCCILAKAIHLLLCTIFHRGLSNGWRRVEDRFLSYVVYHQPLSSIKVSTLVLRSLATNKTKSGKRILFNNKHSQDV